MPTRPAASAADSSPSRARRAEVVGGRDLHVLRVALDDVHGVPGLLRQRRFVGRLDAATAERDRVPQDVAPERLRRLRQVDRLARQRLDDP